MATLDRSRPYAQVYYDEAGRAFEQDGIYYAASGEPWVESPVVAEAKAAKKAKAAAVPEDDQLNAQMAGA